jgi:hypothetical protein
MKQDLEQTLKFDVIYKFLAIRSSTSWFQLHLLDSRDWILPMRKSFKNKRKKKSTNKVPAISPNAPSVAVTLTSNNSGEGAREEARDGLILGLNFVRDLSESTDLFAPLKGASALVIRGLETAKVRSYA